MYARISRRRRSRQGACSRTGGRGGQGLCERCDRGGRPAQDRLRQRAGASFSRPVVVSARTASAQIALRANGVGMNWTKRTMRVPVLAAAALATIVLLLANSWASAAEYKVTVKSAIAYAEHDGVRLVGDLYLPEGRSKAPVVVAFHGGAWRSGSRTFYRYWGPFLARNGYALFTVDYRLGKPGRYPAAVQDANAAVEFVRARAEEFHIDAQRVGLMGDSAGGHLAAL